MRTLVLIAITLLAFLAVTKADDDIQEEYKNQLLKRFRELKEFFKNDPAGQKITKVFHEIMDFLKIVRKKTKSAIKEYAKKLVNDDDKDDD
nr:Tapeworm specific antigen B [Hymenolepis microstoma]